VSKISPTRKVRLGSRGAPEKSIGGFVGGACAHRRVDQGALGLGEDSATAGMGGKGNVGSAEVAVAHAKPCLPIGDETKGQGDGQQTCEKERRDKVVLPAPRLSIEELTLVLQPP
jgi:hypothetical protein